MRNEEDIKGVITMGIGGLYTIQTDTGSYQCTARGSFRKEHITPLPGDNVYIRPNAEKGLITEICERKNSFIRPLVANVDTVVIVIASVEPEPDMLLLDKLLVMSEIKKIRPIICVNKCDLDDGKSFELINTEYKETGYQVISSRNDNFSIDERERILNELSGCGTVMLVGQSGVGKSSMTNLICNENIMQRGALSNKVRRGKNTTRCSRLFFIDIAQIYLIDTPGFTSFENEDIMRDELKDMYPEFRNHPCGCKYKDCNHINEPGCLIKELVSLGEINKNRYLRYTELYYGLKNNKWSKKIND